MHVNRVFGQLVSLYKQRVNTTDSEATWIFPAARIRERPGYFLPLDTQLS